MTSVTISDLPDLPRHSTVLCRGGFETRPYCGRLLSRRIKCTARPIVNFARDKRRRFIINSLVNCHENDTSLIVVANDIYDYV